MRYDPDMIFMSESEMRRRKHKKKCHNHCEPAPVVEPIQKETCSLDEFDNDFMPTWFKDVAQVGEQGSETLQYTEELIVVRGSHGVEVTSTDTQVGVNLQLALQAAVAIIINISVASSEQSKEILQELDQFTQTTQYNRVRTIVENSRNVEVTARNTDVAVTLQLFIQILVALLVSLNIL